MFQDNRLAIEQFDAAIARVGTASLIGKMALHNRAICSGWMMRATMPSTCLP